MADKQSGAQGVALLTKRLRRKGSDILTREADARTGVDSPGQRGGLPALMLRDPEAPPPVDYEHFLELHRDIISRDPHKDVLSFPENDIKVCTEKRYRRTIDSCIPETAVKSTLPHTQRCVKYLTSDLSISERINTVASGARLSNLRHLQSEKEKNNKYPRQEYEVDVQSDPKPEELHPPPSRSRAASLKRSPVAEMRHSSNALEVRGSGRTSLGVIPPNYDTQSSTGLAELEDTEEDDVMQDVLDESVEDIELDRQNKERRDENRAAKIMELYPYMEFEDARIEDRELAVRPAEQIGYRIMVKCLDLSLELEVEPIYAVMALYDIREKKKISENFHFDLNGSAITKMMEPHCKEQCLPSLSRSAIFSLTFPHPDIFLVVKLEKVYQQKEISECAEPYMKENDTAKNRERVRVAAQMACEKLGKFRMPFAWTAINIQEMINSGVQASSFERRDTAKSEDLREAQRTALAKRKESPSTGLIFAPGGHGNPPENPDPLSIALTNFKPVTLTVNSFFRQEGDKLENEYLFKLLAELKKQGSLIRRLKCIPGTLKLDISVPSSSPPCCLTSDLFQVKPYPDPHCRPTREVEEHPAKPVYYPLSAYRNALYVYPTHLNFTNRTGSARNIAIKVSLLSSEDEANGALKVIYGKSSGPKFLKEAWTPITYHSRTPDFYEEVKLQLPVETKASHHLLFTIYHIKSKEKDTGAEPITIGYTWLPLNSNGIILEGDFFQPVVIDKPLPGYSTMLPEVYAQEGVGAQQKWVDNKKPLFKVTLKVQSSIHVQDPSLACFLESELTDSVSSIPSDVQDKTGDRLGQSGAASSLVNGIDRKASRASQMVAPGSASPAGYDFANLLPEEVLGFKIDLVVKKCSATILIQHLPLVINRFLSLLTETGPGMVAGYTMAGLIKVVHQVHDILHEACDVHGRCSVLHTYITYILNALDYAHDVTPAPACSFDNDNHFATLHEALVCTWLDLDAKPMEEAMSHAWFFFDLIAKSMTQDIHAKGLLQANRLNRFDTLFVEKVAGLIIVVSEEVVTRHIKNPKFAQHLNASLAFFLQSLLSLMDRGAVFSMVRAYLRQVSMAAAADVTLAQLKLDLVRVLCSHEHYLQLNLLLSPHTWIQILQGISSTPATPEQMRQHQKRLASVSERNKADIDDTPLASPSTAGLQSSRVSLVAIINRLNRSETVSSNNTLLDESDDENILTEENVYSELSTEYRQTHFVSGLLLNELALILEGNIPKLQRQAIATLRDLMVWHDVDFESEKRSHIAQLYVPLLGIVMDNFTRLWRDYSVCRTGSSADVNPTNPNEFDLGDDAVLVADFFLTASGAGYTVKATTQTSNSSGNRPFNQEVTRDLLICFLWIIKNLTSSQFLRWWSCMELVRRTIFLAVLDVAVAAFEYKGRRTSAAAQGASDVKSRLANAILSGTGTAREKLIERRKQQQMQSKGTNNLEKRWGTTYHQLHLEGNMRSSYEAELDNELESQLACETTLTVLDAAELIISDVSTTLTVLDAAELIISDAALDEEDMLNTMLSYAMRVVIHLLSTNQSVISLTNILASQRSLVSKFPEFLVEVDTEQCAELCTALIRLCNSSISRIRSEASASLYLIMRANYDLSQSFARVKVQSTVGLSNLAAKGMNCNAHNVRKSLRTILAYADADDELLTSTFPDQVRELIGNMHMILRDTVNLSEYNKDPVMLLDLMYRIAKGYQNSPDLRLSWLQNMAQKHTEMDNQTEAAMCLLHAAALVAEYLSMLGEDQFCQSGCADFQKVTPNVLEESAVSDDVLAPDDQAICTSKLFSIGGLVGLLSRSSTLFENGGAWECSTKLNQFLIPIFEAMGDNSLQNKIYLHLAQLQEKIIDQEQKGRRVVSTYFLVKFYGELFEDIDGQEFIYREKPHYKLSELTQRFEVFYERKFGSENLIVIKDSKEPDRSKQDPDKAYLQLAYITPYFDDYEQRRHRTFFDKNHNVYRFFYDVPFTATGKAHGELDSQCKRRTIVTTANAFPYVKTRLEVINTEQLLLSPVEVALEDMTDKYVSLMAAARRDPPDPKGLQLQLQGVVGSRVNSGPAKVATVFLSPQATTYALRGSVSSSPHTDPVLRRLRRCFKDLIAGAQEALEKNRELISENQREYQKELERNFMAFKFELEPIIGRKPQSRFVRQKTCRKSTSKQASIAC